MAVSKVKYPTKGCVKIHPELSGEGTQRAAEGSKVDRRLQDTVFIADSMLRGWLRESEVIIQKRRVLTRFIPGWDELFSASGVSKKAVIKKCIENGKNYTLWGINV